MQTRQTPRKALTVPGKYYTGFGQPVHVHLCDLSVSGCRFASGNDKLPRGFKLQVIIAGRGPYSATVKWCDDGQCGVTFVTPLTPEAFGQFQNTHNVDFSEHGTPAEFKPMSEHNTQRFC